MLCCKWGRRGGCALGSGGGARGRCICRMGIGQLGGWQGSLGSSRVWCIGPGWLWIVVEGGRCRYCLGGSGVGHHRFLVWVRYYTSQPSWQSVAP
jgi:hypothetical protein